MPRTHPPYPPEYRERMVELVRSGRSPDGGHPLLGSGLSVHGPRVWSALSRRAPGEARTAVFDFIEGWYNPTRRHSSLDDVSPTEFERQGTPTPTTEPRGAGAAWRPGPWKLPATTDPSSWSQLNR